jgi:hypothetical protein
MYQSCRLLPRLYKLGVTVLLFLCCCLQIVSAQKPPPINPLEKKLNRSEETFYQGNMRIGLTSGFPKAIYQVNYQVSEASPQTMALQFLTEQSGLLGLSTDDLQSLQVHAVRRSLAGTTVRLHQYHAGIPVYGAEVVVTMNKENVVTQLANDFRYQVLVANNSPTLSSGQARQLVMDYLKAKGHIIFEHNRLVVFKYLRKSELYYQVRITLEDPMGDWEALVNAMTGEILMIEDQACYHHGHNTGGEKEPSTGPFDFDRFFAVGMGNVFDPDPLSSANVAYGGGYVDGGDANTTQLNNQLQSKILRDITFDGANYLLKGPYAEIRDFELPNDGLFSQPTANWNVNRSDAAFEAVNVYYHIDASMRYLNDTLGLNIMPYKYTGGVRFDPHGLSGADNSHYLGGSGQLAFGQGGVDDAEDSDVIHHELGHGLHDWVTTGGLSQVNGLSEGCGDYWAASYNRSLGHWTSSDPAYHWVFNWDGHNPFWNGRIVNYGASYPGDLVNQVHTDGQIWATAMMKVWDAIGKRKSDVAFWNGIGMTSGTSNQDDAANAVIQAAINMGYNHDDLVAMRNIFIATGYMIPPLPPPVVNDNCASATTVTQGVSCISTVGSSALATQSFVGCAGDADDDVWYKFVATSAKATIEVTGNGDYDPVLELYSTCGISVGGSCTNSTGAGGTESYSATGLVIGNTYYYRIYHFPDEVPENWTFQTCVFDPFPAPPNDHCSEAITVSVNPTGICTALTPGTIVNASASLVQDNVCTGNEDDDVWFSFTATSILHSISIQDISGNLTPLNWSLWSGSCGTLTHVICADQSLQAFAPVEIDSTYFIRLYSSGSVSEETSFNICVTTPAPVPNPCAEAALTVTEPYVPNGTYQAIENLSTSNNVTIPLNGAVDFKAGISIDLLANFAINAGATFSAEIVPCDSP